MQKWVALALGVLVPLLGLAGVGSAQSTVQVQGTIQAVDCQAQTIVVATPDSANTIAVAPYTAVLIDSRAVSLCDLQQYVGSQATIWLVASGNEFIATRIDTTAQAAAAPVALPVQQEAVSPLPLVGVVLGTIALAGLIYLLTRDHDGRYYRYPYYGEYYRHYYRPEYRAYAGAYPATCPIVYAAVPIGGVVLGVSVISGFDYLVVRDHDGRYERYPYYGPYRAHYYRPEYRAYAGPYRDAPVRYGDERGSVILHRMDSVPARAPYQRPANDPRPVQYQRPNGPVNYTPIPQRPNDHYRGPQQYQQQPYNNRAPQQYQQYNRQPGYRDAGTAPRGNGNANGGSRGRDTRPVCQSNGQGQSCSDGVHNR
ncbi:MAG TPA: hypothetical protein VGX97_00440 [bacterium]|nr:hypothetical protein [bacterium]